MISKDLASAALDVIKSGDGNAALDLLARWLVEIASGDSAPPAPDAVASVVPYDDPVSEGIGDADGSEGDGAEGTTPPAKRKKLLSARQKRICEELGVSPARFLEIQRAFSATIRTPRKA